MRRYKHIFLWITLLFIFGGKAHSLHPVIEFKKPVFGKFKVIKGTPKVTENHNDQDSPLKRKRRPRAINEAIPQISTVSFEQTWIYKAFQQIWLDNSFSSFLYCVQRKRGPPLV